MIHETLRLGGMARNLGETSELKLWTENPLRLRGVQLFRYLFGNT